MNEIHQQSEKTSKSVTIPKSSLEEPMYLECKKVVDDANAKIAKYEKMYFDLDERLTRETERRSSTQTKAWGGRSQQYLMPTVPKAEQLAKFWESYRPLVEKLRADIEIQQNYVKTTEVYQKSLDELREFRQKADEEWHETCRSIRASWDDMYVTGRPGYY